MTNASPESVEFVTAPIDPLPTAEEIAQKKNTEFHQSVKRLNKKKSSKRVRYQKASFNLRATLVQMVDNEGYSIRQVKNHRFSFNMVFSNVGSEEIGS